MSQVDNGTPTADSGASIVDRLDRYLGNTPAEAPEEQAEVNSDAQDGETQTEIPETAEDQASDDSSESDEPQIALQDVASYLGVDESALDVDEDGSILVRTKIDGQEGTAKFQDLVKSYQLQGHVDAKARQAAEEARILQDRVQQFETYAQSEAAKLSQLAQVAQAEFLADANAIDWQSLARNDPAEYVAKHAEFEAKRNRLNQFMAELNNSNEALRQQQAQRNEHMIQAESQRLTTLIPEWSDVSIAKTEADAIEKYALSQGFSQQDVSSITRADMLAVLRKAWLYDQGKQKATIAEKKVRIAPKLVKPGQSKDDKQTAAEGMQGLRSQIRKTGGKKGVVEYLLASGKV
jgi:hypothetical protein